MPEMRSYTVTQEREIKVWANSPYEAVVIAQAHLDGRDKPQGVPGQIGSPVRERDISAREDY